jgi:hypothetical protein
LAQVAAGLLQRFGLDPASRGRVSSVKPESADDAEGFLFGAGSQPGDVSGRIQ